MIRKFFSREPELTGDRGNLDPGTLCSDPTSGVPVSTPDSRQSRLGQGDRATNSAPLR